jgi:hypothetical protein
MTQDRREWVQWIRVLVDPSAEARGFSLEGLEFKAQTTPDAKPVVDEMYGTLPGDNNNMQPGSFWVVSEDELMRVCPQMEPFAQGKDWFFPTEFCDASLRPLGVDPVQTRDATAPEKAEALRTFEGTQRQLAKK